MWTPQYDIIVETLTGSEFEVTVTDKDTIGYIKSRIQKYEGIPIAQQHLLYNHKELSDTTEMKDVPLGNGSRLKLVLDMKGGPVSARRVVNLPDYDSNWFDLSDVLNTTRHDPLTISTSGMKVLVYKDCKKNVHRIMKLRSDRKSLNAGKATGETSHLNSNGHDDQWVKDNIQTLEKMHQVRTLLDEQKKGKEIREKKDPTKVIMKQQQIKLDDKISQHNKVGVISKNSSQNKPNLLKPDQCVKASKQGGGGSGGGSNHSLVKTKLFPTELQGRKPSCGLLNKYGLNKTCIRPPSLVPQLNKNESCFQLHALAPLSLPPPTYVPKMSTDTDLPTNFQTANLNVIKNNCTNITTTINRPKCKEYNESEDIRLKLRENIRRNRSFKAINDISVDDQQIQKPFKVNTSLSSVLDQFVNASAVAAAVTKKTITDDEETSKSMQDLIEKMNTSTLNAATTNNKPDDFLNDATWRNATTDIECEKEILLAKRSSNCTTAPPPGFENKFFVDRQATVGINSLDSSSSSGCVPDFKLESATSTSNSALDGSYRLYKMSSEAKNNYELPKLLIREDSPVESFHSSDPQLETLTIRGESPKNVIDSYPKLTTTTAAAAAGIDTGEREMKPTTKSIIKSPWSHHHSDLGLNNLELNFLNDDYSDIDTEHVNDNGNCVSSGSVLKIASNLEISSSSWNNSELDGQSQPSTTSLNFINGDLTSSDDEEDVFNSSCCMLHSNSKSKSIELNDFRMMFGSSPTLLNSNFNSSTHHASRLDAVPIQYRRGYTNLNDACLSSSTSDLELFNGMRKKISSKSASQELPSSFSRHHRTTNNSLDFIRSYENLDRAKIIRMKNERSRRNLNSSNQLFCWESSSSSNTTGGSNNIGNNNNNSNRSGSGGGGGSIGCSSNNSSNGSGINKRNQNIHNNFSRERLQEEDLCDDNFSYSNLAYENTIGGGSSSQSNNISNSADTTTTNLPIDFPSDENLFNMNLERFADDFNLLSSASLADRLTITKADNNNKDVTMTNQNSSLILPDVDIVNNINNDITATITTTIVGKKTILNTHNKNTSQISESSEISTKISSILTSHTSLQQQQQSMTITTKKSEKLRCAECNKKLGLIMIMKCHCEKVFCPQHRYAEAHNCSYNFKSEGKKILAKENPLVVAPKLPKI